MSDKKSVMAKRKRQSAADILAPIGKKVAKYRYDKHLTQEGFAETAGVSTPLLTNLESGKLSNITLDKLITFAHAIGEDVSVTLNAKQ